MKGRRGLCAAVVTLAIAPCERAAVHVDAGLESRQDTDLLAAMLQRIRDGEYANIHSVLALKNDSLILEEYFGGYDADTPHELRSATKAIGSILVGIAIEEGFLPSADSSIHRYFEHDYMPAYGWTAQARSVRIRDFLSMTSGYDCDDLAEPAFACESAMYDSDDWVQYSLDLPIVHPRGTQWAYNSPSLILVGETIARASKLSLVDFLGLRKRWAVHLCVPWSRPRGCVHRR